jgi:hypothetical protein
LLLIAPNTQPVGLGLINRWAFGPKTHEACNFKNYRFGCR